MARIAQEEIDRLKRDIAVQRLAEAQGIALKNHGKDLHGLCPFHDDKTPSLVISPEKNLWHCLGACQQGGGPIDWVMKSQGVSFRHAVELLRGDLSFLAAKNDKAGPPTKHSTTQKLPPLVEVDDPDHVVLHRVIAYYHETLKQSPEALAYLQERGLHNAEMIDRFRLGFANRTLGYRMPHKNRQAGAALRDQLTRLGIYRDTGHERFTGSIVVPIYDDNNNVSEIYGRKIGKQLRQDTPLHMYLPGPHRGIFNFSALLSPAKELILCESILDALTFWCAGYHHVTTAYGVEGFTDELLQAMKEHGTEVVKIAYDRDEAGDKAALKVAQTLNDAGIHTYRVNFPKGMDANEYALKVKPAEKSLGVALRNATWMGKGAAPVKNDRPIEAIIAVQATIEAKPLDEPMADEVKPTLDEPEPVVSLAAKEPQLPVQDLSTSATAVEQSSPHELTYRFGDRRWRVRGLAHNTNYEQLRINLMVTQEGDQTFHVDTLELYSARHRALFLRQAADELRIEERVLKKDLGHILAKLEVAQDEQMKKTLESHKAPEVQLSDLERKEALALLKDPKLLDRILADYERCGIVGETTNKLVAYLAAVSRKLDEPLAVVIQSSSAAGKSSLMEAVLAFMPQEERVSYSAMTGQSLFYMGETDLKHKILAIAEEEGAQNAAYALKLLQSEGQLTIASTGKDAATGRLVTHEYRVEGPVMIFLTTTAIEVDEELLNRCIVLSVDEGREQTRAIHERQRLKQTLEGLLAKRDREAIVTLHQNAQRLLQPLFVANPFAKELTFLDHQTRSRRDHMKYLTLIRAIALLHQHQRPIREVTHHGDKVRYIEVTKDDIATANRLATEVLGRSLDELPPHTRKLLHAIEAMVQAMADKQGRERCDVRFSRKDVRDTTGAGDTQLKVHMQRLVELEYLLVHRSKTSQRFDYELVYSQQDEVDGRFLPGLLTNSDPSHPYDANRSGSSENQSVRGRAEVGAKSGECRIEQTASQTPTKARTYTIHPFDAEKARLGTASAAVS
jgi:DNA primase catalytic core